MQEARKGEAILIKIGDARLQAYLQRYPFASGPDHALNKECLEIIRSSIVVRKTTGTVEVPITFQDTVDSELPPDARERAFSLLKRTGHSAQYKRLLAEYGWRVNKIPRDARTVLSLGCGGGHELIFINAVVPDAKISAADYCNSLEPRFRDVLSIDFIEGDVNKTIGTLRTRFDAVFCNHFLEHLYDPDRVVKELCGILNPQGALVAGLPLCGPPDNPFSREIRALAGRPETIHAVDLALFDGGHPWKTNASDLRETLLNGGFRRVDIYQRARHLSRSVCGPRRSFDLKCRLVRCLNRMSFYPVHVLIRLILPRDPPYLVRRLLFALENRACFGFNRFMNDFAPDVVVVAGL